MSSGKARDVLRCGHCVKEHRGCISEIAPGRRTGRARVCRDENRGECFYALICLSRARIRALKGLDALGCLWGRLAFN